MKPGSVKIVPAGKRPKLKNQPGLFQAVNINIKFIISRIRAGRLKTSSFIVASTSILIAVLVLHAYLSSYVYVVFLDGQEIGSVQDAGQIETLVGELTDNLTDYYEMEVAPGNKIGLAKDYRPDAVPDLWLVQEKLRQQLTFVTDAYLIMVDELPAVPVASEGELEKAIDYIKHFYLDEYGDSEIIDISFVENISLKPSIVPPKYVFTGQEVVSLFLDSKVERAIDAAYWSQANKRSFPGHHQYNNYATPSSGSLNSESAVHSNYNDLQKEHVNNAVINVKLIEELRVTEKIPFEVETICDDEMWIVQKEITSPGQEGIKEIVYHIIHENGQEIDKIKVSEAIVEEPVFQVETRGTAQVPSKGTGKFIWPVEGGGEVTPGRGFSSWHTGIDIDAETGTNILAADSGIVWFSGFGGSQGNYIILYHGRYWTLYLHNHFNHVNRGNKVNQGDVIAEVGSTGRSTGSHLHFEVRRDDGSGEWHAYYQHKPVDPLQFFRP